MRWTKKHADLHIRRNVYVLFAIYVETHFGCQVYYLNFRFFKVLIFIGLEYSINDNIQIFVEI